MHIQPGVEVMADPAPLRQVISNLAGNAIKHNHEDDRIEYRPEAGRVAGRFMIQNTGDPIAPGDRLQAFDRFCRADPPRTTAGPGLSLAREIVRAHGGSLTLEEDQGDGLTAFAMPLPGAE